MPYFPLTGSEDKKLYYIDEGKGDVIFFIHSWYQNGKLCYNSYIDHFAEKYRVIIPDLPGHGRSYKKPGENYTIKQATTALTVFLKKLKKERNTIHLVGSSTGAYIALDIAIRNPDLVENIILVSALVDFSLRTQEITAMLTFGKTALKLHLLYRAMRGKFPYDGRKNKLWNVNGHKPGKWKHYKQVAENHPLYAARDYMESFLDASIKDEISKNTKPTLMIYGENDQLTPADFASSLASRMPRGVLRIVEASGHLVYIKRPDRVTRLIDEFLDEHKKRYFGWLKMFFRR
jgi:pimeloyl-ACP methyl ester carboxylesterase